MSMNQVHKDGWRVLRPALPPTHHLKDGTPAYLERYDEVLAFHAPGLAPVRTGERAWHILPDGTAAYARAFHRTFGFYEGLAAVIDAEGWHHILPTGEDAYPQRFVWTGNFQGGRCTVRLPSGFYQHILPNGQPLTQKHWRYVGDFKDGVAVVQAEDGRSTHILADGRLLHSQWFLDLDVFHKGYARAQDADGWCHVNLQGKPIYDTRYAALEPFYNGQARATRRDGGLEIIAESGQVLLELRPAQRSPFASLSADLVGFWKTFTISTAVELKVIDALPGPPAELAQTCRLKQPMLERLLRALQELEIVFRTGEVYALTARGQYLRSDHLLTLGGAALEYAQLQTFAWKHLSKALQEDPDWGPPPIFEQIHAEPSWALRHHQMLQSYARHDYAEVARVLELDTHRHLIDAGGGLGVLSGFLLEHYPSLEVTLLDLPQTVARIAPNHPRLTLKGGDFFQPWGITGADGIVLSRVLHDWNDAACRSLLTQARAALPVGGRLYILELLLEEGLGAGGQCDLHLLAVTGGQERTLAQYSELLKAAGFSLLEVRRTAALPTVLVAEAQSKRLNPDRSALSRPLDPHYSGEELPKGGSA